MTFFCLVTAHHAGDLSYLARLQTVLLGWRAALGHHMLLIDTGGAWSGEVWSSTATQHRAPYWVLDAMNYHAVLADGLNDTTRASLQPHLQMRLVAPAELPLPLPQASPEQPLRWKVTPGASTPSLHNGILGLPTPPKGRVGWVEYAPEGPEIIAWQLREVNLHTLPDPSITAVVEFVESEARYFQRKKGNAHAAE
ncbi:MAG: hypothetical protein HC915_02195 [Anaerolineae bacterium]|nr:hypothetical protein [Anaerolineae bacterium]